MNKIFRLNDQQLYELCELLIQRKKEIDLKIKTFNENNAYYDLRIHTELNIIVELLDKFGYNFIG